MTLADLSSEVSVAETIAADVLPAETAVIS